MSSDTGREKREMDFMTTSFFLHYSPITVMKFHNSVPVKILFMPLQTRTTRHLRNTAGQGITRSAPQACASPRSRTGRKSRHSAPRTPSRGWLLRRTGQPPDRPGPNGTSEHAAPPASVTMAGVIRAEAMPCPKWPRDKLCTMRSMQLLLNATFDFLTK